MRYYAREASVKLKNKILIAVGLAWALFLCITYVGSRTFLLNSFLDLEQKRADENLGRVDQALDQVNYALSTFTSDWSHWNDLYDYMQGKKPNYVPDNLNMTAFVNSHINLVSYWDKFGKIVVGAAVDTDKQILIAFPKGLERYLSSNSKLLKRNSGDVRGYILVEPGIMLIASSMVTDGDVLLPPLGVSIFGRNLDQALISKLMETTKVDIKLFLPSQIKTSAFLSTTYKTISSTKSGHFIKPVDEDNLQGFTIIKDINNMPIGMLQMTTPRSIYQKGLATINYYLISFCFLAIIFSFLMLKLINVMVTRRLEKLDHQLSTISSSNDLGQRVDAEGSDELSSVSIEINYMLDIIQASQENLERRVQERTKELQTINLQLQKEITERKTVERELVMHKEHLIRIAHYDSLTSLPNRIYFNEMLDKAIQYSKRHNKMLAILFIDLDRFKNINDALGHTFGDAVLKEVALRFSGIVRSGDVLARLGGDEFIMLLNNIANPKQATVVAEKILAICVQAIKIDSHELFLNASIGISLYPTDGNSLEDVQKNADMAMYKAKRNGGSNYQFYTPELDTLAHEHIRLEAELRKAIKNKEFVLYYQPQFNLMTQKINRVEALIRWEHPTIGIISPIKFIPLAEETGLIMDIGEWVLFESCRAAKKWQDQGLDPITVSVNVSAKQFRHQDISQMVTKALQETGLEAKYLELELTESAVMDNVDLVINKLKAVHEMGVSIAIDDFGTGYTSINYLRQLPVDIIKIDRTFIKGLPQNQDDATITAAILLLAHQLGMEVVAEGVETVEQLNFLHEKGCDMIQGYYISPPQPLHKIEAYIAKFEEVQ